MQDNTIILLFNPNLVDGIQIHTWGKNQTMRLIPTIKISNTATVKELTKAVVTARLIAVDIDSIHIKESSKKKQLK